MTFIKKYNKTIFSQANKNFRLEFEFRQKIYDKKVFYKRGLK